MEKNVKGKLSFLIMFVLLAIAASCTKSDENPNYNPPADHTISQDGFMHKPGLNQPLANCVTCHGGDLRGGTVGVSCYECHGQKW